MYYACTDIRQNRNPGSEDMIISASPYHPRLLLCSLAPIPCTRHGVRDAHELLWDTRSHHPDAAGLNRAAWSMLVPLPTHRCRGCCTSYLPTYLSTYLSLSDFLTPPYLPMSWRPSRPGILAPRISPCAGMLHEQRLPLPLPLPLPCLHSLPGTIWGMGGLGIENSCRMEVSFRLTPPLLVLDQSCFSDFSSFWLCLFYSFSSSVFLPSLKNSLPQASNPMPHFIFLSVSFWRPIWKHLVSGTGFL
jgi:hypothetical protein